jgi:hypothetical protein
MTQGEPPPVEPVEAHRADQPVRPHRGGVILVLGILSLLCSCFILGVIAWALGSADLREMREGRMDPAGRGLTQAGMICGIISVLLSILYLFFWMIWFLAAAPRGGGRWV